jgi:phosphatidylglycerophosphate synthase
MSDGDFGRFVILADESARWKIAGLRQLDRLALVLSEFAETSGRTTPIDAVIFWDPEIPPSGRWLPRHRKINRVRLTEALSSAQPGDRGLTTRIFIERNKHFIDSVSLPKINEPIVDPAASWNRLVGAFGEGLHAMSGDGWRYLRGADEIPGCEKEFLRRMGKSQDGLISKILNRRLSRLVTRFLLRYPISPSGWTLSILVLVALGALCLIRGDYAGFVAGTAFFQIYNVLDGCDGEIARAKYLDSEKGRRLDGFCDLVANLVFILCLGFGLFRQRHMEPIGAVYLLEAVAACSLEVVRMARYIGELINPDLTRPVSLKQQEVVAATGQRFFGKTMTTFLFEITKRDVAFFAFLLLAIAGVPWLVLHFLFLYAGVTFLLALRDFGRRFA